MELTAFPVWGEMTEYLVATRKVFEGLLRTVDETGDGDEMANWFIELRGRVREGRHITRSETPTARQVPS